MKHKHNHRILGRTRNERVALMRQLGSQLLDQEILVTTESRAKELRKYLEPLISTARNEITLHRRRQLTAQIGKLSVEKLVTVGERMRSRPGGYIRLTRLPMSRGDGSQTVRVELIKD